MTAPAAREGGVVLTASEILLAAMTLAALIGHTRLFDDSGWRAPLIVAAVSAHLVVGLMRRLGRGLLSSAVVAAAMMIVQITLTHYRQTATLLLPTGTTRDAVELDLRTAWQLFDEVKAPTASITGFLVLSSVAIWVIAFLADWAAFRLSSAFEALVPGFAMVVFIAYFGVADDRILTTTIYLLAVAWFLLLHRIWREARHIRWLAGTERAGTSAIVRAGAVVSAIAVLGAIALGPALPGAGNEALVDLDPKGDGDGIRRVDSPIVDIRGRLVDLPDIEVFTVRTETPQYYRLASLDLFNGSVWGASSSFRSASGELPDDFPTNAAVTVVDQQFSITELNAVWVPAAFEPRAVREASDDSISYEATSGTLIVGRDRESSDGLTYTVTSAIPTFDPVALAAAPDAYPPEILEKYLGLPDDFSPAATELARALTDGLTSDFDKAIALQSYFQGNFVYDLDVGAGHSSDRIDQFLESGRGYCEQFAGSFAAMARAIGMPARVVVGFTWGDQDPSEPDLWRVRGEHAHAWPEVYFPGSGWVAFEPTPGRGAPGANGWTGVAPAQVGDTPADPSLPPPTPAPTVEPGLAPRELGDIPEIPTQALGGGDDDAGLPPAVAWFFRVVGLVVAAGGAYAAAIIGLKALRRSRRRAAAADNRDRVQTAWFEGVESLRPLGLEPDRAETAAEFAHRAGNRTPMARDVLTSLGSLSVTATFGVAEPDENMVDEALRHRDSVGAVVRSLATIKQRVLDKLDPRPLLR